MREELQVMRRLGVLALVVAVGAVYLYQAVLLPVVFSFCLTVLLAPLVDALDARGIPRWSVVSSILGLTLGGSFLAMAVLVPTIYREILALARKAPYVYSQLSEVWLPELEAWVLRTQLLDDDQWTTVQEAARQFLGIADRLPQALLTVVGSAPALANLGVSLFLVPLLTFFSLKDYPRFVQPALSLVPLPWRDDVAAWVDAVVQALRAVFRGQALVALSLGLIYVVGFNFVGVYAATAIGIVSGVCRIVPYLDIVVSLLLCSLASASVGGEMSRLLSCVGIVIVAQSVDAAFLTPRIMGQSVGLHPALVILSLLGFGAQFGFVGALLAIPFVAIAKVCVVHALRWVAGGSPRDGVSGCVGARA